jgi:hypothetical protein
MFTGICTISSEAAAEAPEGTVLLIVIVAADCIKISERESIADSSSVIFFFIYDPPSLYDSTYLPGFFKGTDSLNTYPFAIATYLFYIFQRPPLLEMSA